MADFAPVSVTAPIETLASVEGEYRLSELVWGAIFAVAVLFQVVTILGLLRDVLAEWLYSWRHGSVWRAEGTEGTVSIVVPCFMPNEHAIIEDTLQHLFEELEFENDAEASRVSVCCVYNAPKTWSHPIQERLEAMDGRCFGPWARPFRLVRAAESKSKAENLNLVIPQLHSTYTVIYDADHHPDKASLKIAVQRLEKADLDCVQGSTYIRSGHNLMGCLIDAEFFFNYFVILRALAGITQTGFFGGSNALWRTTVLQQQLFDHAVQTEDIEYSLRALLRNVRIGFCPEARSGELAPASWKALWRQRKRWALGWDQVTLMHTGKMVRSELSVLSKVALLWTFILRWVSIIAMLALAFVHPLLIGVKILHEWFEVSEPFDYAMFERGWPMVFMHTSMVCFVALLLATGSALVRVERPVGRLLRQTAFVALFFVFACVPILLMAVLQLSSFRDIYRGDTAGWVVTTRAPAKHVQLPEKEAQSATPVSAAHTVSEPDPEVVESLEEKVQSV